MANEAPWRVRKLEQSLRSPACTKISKCVIRCVLLAFQVLKRDYQVELPCSCAQIMREMKQEMERDRCDSKVDMQICISRVARRMLLQISDARVVESEAELTPGAQHNLWAEQTQPKGSGLPERRSFVRRELSHSKISHPFALSEAGQGYNSLLPEFLGSRTCQTEQSG